MPIPTTCFKPELITSGLHSVIYVELYCSQDGCFRVGLEGPLDDMEQFPCPACGQERPAAVIGSGLTTHPTPIIEMVHSPLPEQGAERRHRRIPIQRLVKARVRSLAAALR
jgi:hypothetical protein